MPLDLATAIRPSRDYDAPVDDFDSDRKTCCGFMRDGFGGQSVRFIVPLWCDCCVITFTKPEKSCELVVDGFRMARHMIDQLQSWSDDVSTR